MDDTGIELRVRIVAIFALVVNTFTDRRFFSMVVAEVIAFCSLGLPDAARGEVQPRPWLPRPAAASIA
jgi:hypothetical protein